MNIYVLGNADKPGVAEEVARWLPQLREFAQILTVDLRQEQDLNQLPRADIALVFGGDGAILRAARQMGYRQVPVLGVNLGRLGFLADIHPTRLEESLHCLQNRGWQATSHLMYECEIDAETSPPGENRKDNSEPRKFLGLNEVVIHSMPPLHMLDLELEVDGVEVSHFHGDGLIISTPIGSTAHNLSAGGPILGQELSAFVVTPICPHTLTFRPLVESADKTFRVRVTGREKEPAILIIDGQETALFGPHNRITIARAPVSFQLVRLPGRGFFQTLHDKLRWGTPPTYRSEPE